MPTLLKEAAVERSTFGISALFYDERGSAVTPNAGLTWTLVDAYGNVVNNRQSASVTPATALVIGLTNNDLRLSGYSGNLRHVIFEGTYDSATLGTGQALRDWVSFYIQNSIGIV